MTSASCQSDSAARTNRSSAAWSPIARQPIEPEPHLQTVLFAKVVIALMLDRSASGYLEVQRAAHLRRMRELTERKRTGSTGDAVLADHGLFHLEADLRWIDVTEARLQALKEMVNR